MVEHTPPPWYADRAGDVCAGNFAVAILPGSRTDAEERANAAFIVRAVNSHEALVEALAWFIDDIDGTHTVMVDFDANVDRARAALALARGESPSGTDAAVGEG